MSLDLTGLISSDQLEGLRELNLERAASGQQMISILDILNDDSVLEGTGITATSDDALNYLNQIDTMGEAAENLEEVSRFSGATTNEILQGITQADIEGATVSDLTEAYIEGQTNANITLDNGTLNIGDLADYGQGSSPVLAPDGQGVIRNGVYIPLDPTQSSMSYSEIQDLKSNATKNTNLLLAQQELEENGTPIADTLGLKQPGDKNFDRDDRERIQEAESAAEVLLREQSNLDYHKYLEKKSDDGPSAIEIHNQIFGGGGNAPGTVKQDENGDWYAVKEIAGTNATGRDYSIDPKDDNKGPTFGGNVSKDIEEMFPNEVAAAGGSSDFQGSILDTFKDTDVGSLGYDPATGTYSKPVVTEPVETDIAQPGDLDLPEVLVDPLEGEDYTPTAAQLAAQLQQDGLEDLRTDISDVDYTRTGSGAVYDPVASGDALTSQEISDLAASALDNVEDDDEPLFFRPGQGGFEVSGVSDSAMSAILMAQSAMESAGQITKGLPGSADDFIEKLIEFGYDVKNDPKGVIKDIGNAVVDRYTTYTFDDGTTIDLFPPSEETKENIVMSQSLNPVDNTKESIEFTFFSDNFGKLVDPFGITEKIYDTTADELGNALIGVGENIYDTLSDEQKERIDKATVTGDFTDLVNFLTGKSDAMTADGSTVGEKFGEDPSALTASLLGQAGDLALDLVIYKFLGKKAAFGSGFAEGYEASSAQIREEIIDAYVKGNLKNSAEFKSLQAQYGSDAAALEALMDKGDKYAAMAGGVEGVQDFLLGKITFDFSKSLPRVITGGVVGGLTESITEGTQEAITNFGSKSLADNTIDVGRDVMTVMAQSLFPGMGAGSFGAASTRTFTKNDLQEIIDAAGASESTVLSTFVNKVLDGEVINVTNDGSGNLMLSTQKGEVVIGETDYTKASPGDVKVTTPFGDVVTVKQTDDGNFIFTNETNGQTKFTNIFNAQAMTDFINETNPAGFGGDGTPGGDATVSDQDIIEGSSGAELNNKFTTSDGIVVDENFDMNQKLSDFGSVSGDGGIGSLNTGNNLTTANNTSISTANDGSTVISTLNDDGSTTVSVVNNDTNTTDVVTVDSNTNTEVTVGGVNVTVDTTTTGSSNVNVTGTPTTTTETETTTGITTPTIDVPIEEDTTATTTFDPIETVFVPETSYTPEGDDDDDDDDTDDDLIGEQDPGYTSGIAGLSGARPTVAPYYQPQQVGDYSFYTPQPGITQAVPAGPVFQETPQSYLAPTATPQYGYGYIAPNADLEYLKELARIQGTGAEKLPSEALINNE